MFVQGDNYDRLAWAAWLYAEIGIEDSIAARATLSGDTSEYRAAVRMVRCGFWSRKSEMLREFIRRHGVEPPPRDTLIYFGRDENEYPYAAWGEEAELLGLTSTPALEIMPAHNDKETL